MVCRENWALSVERIEEYLLSIEGTRRTENGHYEQARCLICLSPLPDASLGPIPIPRTLVEFSGEEEAVEAVRRQFALRFLSAGG